MALNVAKTPVKSMESGKSGLADILNSVKDELGSPLKASANRLNKNTLGSVQQTENKPLDHIAQMAHEYFAKMGGTVNITV